VAAVTCFEPLGDWAHGNFLAASYKAIAANPDWRRRLAKVHTHGRRSLPTTDRGRWRELDSCMSSDALLMNVFCYPRVLANERVADALGVERGAAPRFGFPARVPLKNGRCDRTEVDMKVGNLLVEAKLTESDFQRTEKARLLLYRDFSEVLNLEELPRSESHYDSYQIIRNILAAHATGCSFCVLLDARRPDLMERYYAVIRCVRPIELRMGCRVLTWQELARFLPGRLRKFLTAKYGIS
jgi:hypothetical protein